MEDAEIGALIKEIFTNAQQNEQFDHATLKRLIRVAEDCLKGSPDALERHVITLMLPEYRRALSILDEKLRKGSL